MIWTSPFGDLDPPRRIAGENKPSPVWGSIRRKLRNRRVRMTLRTLPGRKWSIAPKGSVFVRLGGKKQPFGHQLFEIGADGG